MPGRRAFLRRGHVAAAAAGIGHDRRHRGPVGAYPARGAARCRPGLRATRPRTKRFPAVGGGTRRGTAPSRWPRASVPARQRQRTPRRLPAGRSPCPSWRPGRSGPRRAPGTPGSPGSSAGPSAARQHPGADEELVSEPGTPQRNSPGKPREQARQRTPAAVTAATAKTPLQITCPRRGSGPAAVTAKTPKMGLEITAGVCASLGSRGNHAA
jgi:hypothetical protein